MKYQIKENANHVNSFDLFICFFVFQPEAFHTSSNVTQSVRMIEQHWRVHPSGETVSRGLFMAALQNITHIFIRGASSVAFTSLTLVCSLFVIYMKMFKL